MKGVMAATMAVWFLLGAVQVEGSWTEDGDAGDMPNTAQTPIGTGMLDFINGYIDYMDADMYTIYIPDPAAFSAVTSALGDVQLFLFDENGMGICANDDILYESAVGDVNLDAHFPLGHPEGPDTPGIYYLAISGWDTDPLSQDGMIFPSEPYEPIYGPTGYGGSMPISNWYYDDWAEATGYTITLTGVEFVAPEPATLALLALGGLVLRKRK